MVTFDDVAVEAHRLPEVTEGQKWRMRTWNVRDQGFAWERPLSKADVKRLGDQPVPEGPILALRTEDLHERAALLAEGRRGFFTIAHFDGYPAVLLQLDVIDLDELRAALQEAWLAVAPPDLAERFLAP